MVSTICTGSALLAKTGLLDGMSATTNKRAYTWVESVGPNVSWNPKARWVEDKRGNVEYWTRYATETNENTQVVHSFTSFYWPAPFATAPECQQALTSLFELLNSTIVDI
jgi:putative intracellular protease/amidase